ncbi:RNA polymerase sigma factor [Nannocystis radixulma]|uniref:Sigma-70 family RNA polymerase sigma factor n=1 Tax=Nannocystis radixulma TaxID=2995305 RepID=A0ABT5B8T4_9BACT|nr:sigma-70 family RNA polymerase sigma factor [Nannocystis radixulma]MDC0670128.1 sigma-70 family RNA polymerase sigma factor [Nannocystis radixulma]
MRLRVVGSDDEPARPGAADAAASLLELAQAGDPRTGEALFDLVGAQVNRLVWRVLGADEDHDDLVQQVFVALLAGLTRVREADALRGWVAAVTVNTVRSEIRRRRVRRWFGMQAPADEAVHTPTASHEARELLERTYAVLARLPADERIAFALRFIDEQPLGDVAAACNCSLATVKRRISAAQARFRRLAERDPMLAEHLRELEVQR